MSDLLFQAIVELSNLVSNPSKLKEAAKTAADAIKLKDEEVAKREEYNDLLKKVREDSDKLKSTLRSIDSREEALEKKSAEIEAEAKGLKEGRAELSIDRQAFEDEKAAFKKLCEERLREFDLESGRLARERQALDASGLDLDQRRKDIEAKEVELAKYREILGR